MRKYFFPAVFVIVFFLSNNSRTNAQIGKLGINTTTPAAMLHVKDSNVVFTGPAVPLGNFNPPVSGAGTRLMWYPDKAAFRAGTVDGTQWDKDNIGFFSVAFGNNTIASHAHTYAFGDASIATGLNSIAIGQGNAAVGEYSLSLGNSSRTSGFFTIASGYGVTAKSYQSAAFGSYNDSIISSNPNSWINTDPLFIVGNGLNSNARSNALILFKNGNMTIAGTLTQNSDARLKKNILPLQNSLQKILLLGGYHYNWMTQNADQKLQTGLLAQEIEQQMPELVKTDEKGMKAVNYSGMIPYLVEAVKELKNEIELLKKEIEQLKEKK